MISQDELTSMGNRKPARRGAEIPAAIRDALAVGAIESKNLVEWLNVDRLQLSRLICKQLGLSELASQIDELASADEKLAALKMSMRIGSLFATSIKIGDASFQFMSTHASDVVREWVAIVIGAQEKTSFARKLAHIKPFADDPNPGVREIAWIAMRRDVILDPTAAISRLVPWTGSRTANLRRYASEITRPCGVWAAHIPQLKDDPKPGLFLLEPLRADESKYVRDSVANWLNDAGKTHAPWVRELTKRWTKESPCKETDLIVRRAMRRLKAENS